MTTTSQKFIERLINTRRVFLRILIQICPIELYLPIIQYKYVIIITDRNANFRHESTLRRREYLFVYEKLYERVWKKKRTILERHKTV